ncbi:superoxide dismutase family protein [Nocardioides zhouii]|uniref:Superoxide dismutase family protein n=1 Tax=Nocardioides zhouii TaxID=1168729 RepID=A0A4Q2T1H1_9ACTN|nr:superoxide dismutase family protein [Nocardioides zhouii]RYC10784.1 superoxide dismutase family protein [Nocardioides zhouii]
MTRLMIGAVIGAGVLAAVPAIAIAGNVLVDHGRGPTVVHDVAYAGVRTQVHSWARDGGTDVRLMVRGLPANRPFGAHVHVTPCGTDPLASGGHYQHGTTGTLAEREVWLDFTTDEEGNGVGSTHISWLIAAGTAGSVVIHANPTNTTTGAAGPRQVCTNVPFGE